MTRNMVLTGQIGGRSVDKECVLTEGETKQVQTLFSGPGILRAWQSFLQGRRRGIVAGGIGSDRNGKSYKRITENKRL